MFNRDQKEEITDRIILAYLLKQYREYKSPVGITGIQKLSFLSELQMINQKIKGMNYTFFKWFYGPMSKQIYSDLDLLRDKNWITKPYYQFTEKGSRILGEFIDEYYTKNKQIFNIIENTIKEFAKYDAGTLTKKIYKMSVLPVETVFTKVNTMLIKDIPQGWDIIGKLDKADLYFDIDDDWLESLEIEFILTPKTKQDSKITVQVTKEELFEAV